MTRKKGALAGFLAAFLFFMGLGEAIATKLYVTNISDNSLSITEGDWRNPKGWRVVKTISVGKMPHVPAVSPDGKKLFVTMAGSDEVWTFDPATDKLVRKIALGVKPSHIIFSPDSRYAYVSLETSQELAIVDTKANSVVAKIFV